jgi:hypothetical protein
MSNDCSEISGRYIDGEPDHMGGLPPGVWVFSFPYSQLRIDDNTVKSRGFSIYFDAEKSLHVDYLIDGNAVLSKTFIPSDYVCKKQGLRLSTYKRTGEQIYDMFPNRGTIVGTLLMFRVNDGLYIKESFESKATFGHIIPSTSHSERWTRFLIQQP